MSHDDFDVPPEDVSEEQAALQRALEQNNERNMVLRAIHVAHGIEHELRGEVPGYLLHYLREMRDQAIEAAASLLTSRTLSEEERVQARMNVQPYAHLMIWLKGKVAYGRNASAELEDLDALIEGRHEDFPSE